MNTQARWPHANGIHLVLTSLGSVIVDADDIRSVRAEDASGGFGLWPGHADFLTVLRVSVLSWRDAAGTWHHCALRRGVLSLRGGCELSIATREAVAGDDLEQLEALVRGRLAERQQAEDTARREERQLAVRAMRELLRPMRAPSPGSPP
jgi:F-type H+-transporting ATPase subunit epsilon